MRRSCSIWAPLCLLLCSGSARAATLYVDAAGQGPFAGIQPAIDAALDGDLILVFGGTYGPIDFLGKDLVVRSVFGPGSATIDATGTGGPGVTFAHGEPASALLHGFTITGGVGVAAGGLLATTGGGIHVTRAAQPRISGNVVAGNVADTGAGIGIVDASPTLYGNVLRDNVGSDGAGGLAVLRGAGAPGTATLSCNQLLGNAGTDVGGAFLGADVQFTNNAVHGNSGERGGVWVVAGATGAFHNNTVTTNSSAPGAAAGVHVEATQVAAVGNLVAHNLVGFGVIHSAASPQWSYGDLWDNAGGAWSGPAPDPTGSSGNVSIEPAFRFFTATGPFDDELALAESHPLLNAGSPAAAFADLDGSRGAIGVDGGPREACDLDGDGVRAVDVPADCRPTEAGFHPGANEQPDGLDRDCDGYASLAILDFVTDDGGLGPASPPWEFGVPALPGAGVQGAQAWCTGCAGPAGGGVDAALVASLDLTSLPTGAVSAVHLVHAFDADDGFDGGVFEVWDGLWVQAEPASGYPSSLDSNATSNPLHGGAALGVWSGDSAGWVTDRVDLSDWSGSLVDVRLRYGSSVGSSSAGWSLGRLAVAVLDADGDGRSAPWTDCDDAAPSVYDGAPEVAYDGIDQDCDGADLTDVDADGFDAIEAGGTDCDDGDAAVYAGGTEVAYDGVDQDCDGADLVDVDGDGHASWEVGGGDCDDDDPLISPDALEVAYDGIDQDCDGGDLVDADGDGFRGDIAPPFGDCDDDDAAVHPDAEELCDDATDNNCDELVDREVDYDEDGYDRCQGDCDEGDAAVSPGRAEVCDGHDTDCSGEPLEGEVDADGDGDLVCAGDCDDLDDAVGPSRPEICDGKDNDCDHGTDEDQDGDGDGFSACTSDCDDQRSTVYPGARIDCADNLDHDCDGAPDFAQPECAATGCGASMTGRSTPGLGLLLILALVARTRRRVSGP